MTGEKIRLSAILVLQGKFRFYVVSMPSDVLRDTCFTITREDDPIEGFQRRLDPNRANDIANYIDKGVGSIPTAIIVSAQEQTDLKYNSKTKTISFKNQKKAFIIIDGQHRVWGFTLAKNSIRVPVVIYEGLTRVEEAQLFIDINVNQKQVPDSLLLDVKRLLQRETDEEKRYSELFDMFYADPNSVLRGHLVRGENRPGKLSRIMFNKAIADLLRSELLKVPNKKCFDIINNYLKAVQQIIHEIEPKARGITKAVTFQGMMAVSRYVIEKTVNKHEKLTQDAFYDILKELKNNISKEVILRPGNSYRKFSDKVLEALSRLYIEPTIITEE
ncbi:MAG: DGQHR domain-containing protein [Bacillota bacterium]